MTVTISDEIKRRWPETALGVLVYQAQVEESSPQLLEALHQAADQLAQTYALDTIAKNPHIAATRQAYKALGDLPPRAPQRRRGHAPPGGEGLRPVSHQQRGGGE